MANNSFGAAVAIAALLTFLLHGKELESFLFRVVIEFFWIVAKAATSFVPILFSLSSLYRDELDTFLDLCLGIMEARALELVDTAKNNNVSLDVKQSALTAFKSEIKQRNVPEAAVPPTFEALRVFIASPNTIIVTPAFSMLSHLIKRLFIQQQPHLIAIHSRILHPLLLERLGDHKERVRAQAAQAFTELWPAANAEVEHHVLETALVGKNPKAKEMALIWLSNMSKNHGLRFRQYVANLVNCLEDADPAVRDTAKLTVVELFGAASGASARAKSDLMKQLSIRNVRKTIVNTIVTHLGLDTAETDHISRPLSRADGLTQRSTEGRRPASRADGLVQRPLEGPRPVSRAEGLSQRSAEGPRPASRADGLMQRSTEGLRPMSRAEGLIQRSTEVSMSTGDMATGGEVPAPRPTSRDGESVEPLMVSSSREIEDLVRGMLPHFEGRESEGNWAQREKNVLMLRRLVHGNAPVTYSNTLITALKTLLDGIFKVATSLRTTMSTNGCLLVQDIAVHCGSRIDSMVEIIMQNLIKLSAVSKKITAQNGKMTVETVIQHVSFTPRILQHIFSASQDKNAQLRLYSADWFKIVLDKQVNNKAAIEHGGGLDMLEKGIKKGLSDANPTVRVAMRGTFWIFFGMWPIKGNEILSDLDPKSRSQLEKDPNNPNFNSTKGNAPLRKGVASGPSSSKASKALHEAIAAKKRAHLAPKPSQQVRPQSAQSSVAEISMPESHTKQPVVRSVPTGAPISSLSSAPMRPASKARRPELSRPATAEPYSVRPIDHHLTMSDHRITVSDQQITVPATITAKARAKRLDIAKTRGKEPFMNGSHLDADVGGLSSGGSQVSIVPNEHDNPAEVQLESPPDTVVQMLTPSDVPAETGFSCSDEPADDQVKKLIPREPKLAPSRNEVHERQPDAVQPTSDATTSYADLQHPNLGGERRPSDDAQDLLENSERGRLGSSEHRGERRPSEYVEESVPLSYVQASDRDLESTGHGGERKLSDPGQESIAGELGQESIAGEPKPINDRGAGQHEHNVGARHSAPNTINNVDAANTVGFPSVVPVSHPDPQDSEFEGERAPNNEAQEPIPCHSQPSGSSKIEQSQAGGEKKTSFPEHFSSEPVKIFEDPIVTTSPIVNSPIVSTRNVTKNSVLEELSLNEPSHRDLVDGSEQRRRRKVENAERRRSISPRSKDPAKAREMLEKGVQKIRSKNMDILGYRKLQGLIEYHDSIFIDEDKYDEMLLVLLEELQSPPDEKRQRLGRPLDLKTQVLLTIRFMLAHNKHYVSPYYPIAIAALITARNYYDSSSHIINGLNETAEELLAHCEPEGVIDAVADLVSGEDPETGDRAITMGFSVMTDILKKKNGDGVRLPGRLLEKVGSLAGKSLTARQPDVRRQATQLCVQLHTMANNDDHFWQLVGWPRENSRNLLTYYIARK
ncbi:uncharacterized protein BO97DRAFT_415306 [Aspergillus homomorphus CBS 101889]|uniref:ARM repeat-containing protein n=1 Tax=Aspergillus homomorphus (strain CBS 101889) TaxID=1450537 RepID=A0A395HU98_ASPHC|nr:ARM repeat-containing protein [Aspergillus homomorphus CBS 101889]RAL11116.1 ARM repeat-containing protein [Aspergillus homomorphus CBS 101889]